MAHKTDYRFYIQPYPTDENPTARADLEVLYGCDYMKFSGINQYGEVQNIYSEPFAEQSGVGNIYIPPKIDLAYKDYECKLTLMFKGSGARQRAEYFQHNILGKKVEYSDNFRNIYMTLLMEKPMEIESERLYGSQQYVVATFTFTNILGYTYNATKL